ncbi:MAG: peptide chain release factor 3, partial [Pseudomonadota bacterium]|nr:peptide chain release factor 3 [Pseudomonadota bacterium]
ALTEGEEIKFTGIPSFAPELLQTVRPKDPMKSKHLGRALNQLAEEGAARVFKPRIGADWIIGAVGALQFEVMADRIRTEYEVPVIFEPTSLFTARWVEASDHQKLKHFIEANTTAIADDHDKEVVFLARNAWHLDRTAEDFPEIKFLKTREQTH